MDKNQFKESILTTVCEDGGLTHEDYICKIKNIQSFLHIERTGLCNGKLEKRLLMYNTLAKEEIYIEYPGKESTAKYEKSGEKNVLNPNDFRPELYTSNGENIAKMSFVDIVEALVEYAWIHDKEIMQMLATLIIRLAYMRGYICKKFMHPSNLIKVIDKKSREIMDEKREDLIERYYLPVNRETKEYLSSWDKIRLPNRDYSKKVLVSIEGFLYYLDILAQQEDCKYYYTRKLKGDQNMKIGVGRVNNLLTIVNVINRIINDRPCGDIVSSFGKGVRPIKTVEMELVTGGLVKVVTDLEGVLEIKLE